MPKKKTKKIRQKFPKFLILEVILAFGILAGLIASAMYNDKIVAKINETLSKIGQIESADAPTENAPIQIDSQILAQLTDKISAKNLYQEVIVGTAPATLQATGKQGATLTGYLFANFSEADKTIIPPLLKALDEEIYDGTLRLYFVNITGDDQIARAGKCLADKYTDPWFWKYLDLLYQKKFPLKYRDLMSGVSELDLSQYFFAKCLQYKHFQDQVQAEYDFASGLNITQSPTLIIDNKKIDLNLKPEIIESLIKIIAKQKNAISS